MIRLNRPAHTGRQAQVLKELTLFISGISSFLSSLNFMGTISNLRFLGFLLCLIPLFLWAILITALLLLLVLPILTGTLGILLADLHFN